MKIQLFLADKEVELNDKVAFPLNKSFENLWNPTDIIVEYSKSIKIPATAANNRLMANAYRIDRQFVVNENNTNIGLYLDPLKRIPMKLVYNGTILLDGYAKYQSATSNSKETYYTFNLHGVLGDIFQSLLDCVVDSTKLTDEQKAEADGGAKYVISSTWDSQLINKDFIKASWDDKLTSIATSATNPHRHIGMAPAYRGYYTDFESNSVYALNGAFLSDVANGTSVEEQLKHQWKANLKSKKGYTEEEAQARVDSLDFNMILPNGLNEHNMRQFRSYEQKPYIYFYSLMNLYQKKCKELTGYEIKLDSSWFNINNPYWTRLCYMFDYLSVKGATIDSSLPFTGYSEKLCDTEYFTSEAKYNITDTAVLSKGDITIDSFTLGMQVKAKPAWNVADPNSVVINMPYKSHIKIDVIVETGGTKQHNYFWGGVGDPTTSSGPNSGYSDKWTDDEYIYMATKTEYDSKNDKLIWNGYLTVPSFKITHKAGDSISITYDVQYITGTYAGNSRYKWTYSYTNIDGGTSGPTGIPYMGDIGKNEWLTVVNNEDYKFIFPNVTYSSNWRTSTTCDLKNLYTKDEPLFNVILQYTKMFGLIWKPDYQNKTIDLMTRKSYFKDYEVVDWTDKVDKSKGLTIEPVSFNSKYVIFNYEDVEGYRYSGYKNKYGVDYGEKKLTTKYNFDTKEDKLFSQKIHPSSISCKSFPTVSDLREWDTISTLPSTESEINFIDCENDDQTASISINNWYFRDVNFGSNTWYLISDVSERELAEGKYYWYSNIMLPDAIRALTQVLPQFSPVFPASAGNPTIGCLFNCPNDDYTKDFQISSAQGNYIYDVCWEKYINERYNANNKKVTCYVRLSPTEYEQFNFKTFVTVDNQLFVVNKIQDYDVNNVVTKVELIQVSDINGYTAQNIEFKEVIYYGDEINISPSVSTIDNNSYVGYGGIKVRCYPRLDGVADIAITKISGNENSELVAYDWQADDEDIEENDPLTPVNAGDGTLIFRWSAPSFNASEEWRVKITAFGESRYIPVYISYN